MYGDLHIHEIVIRAWLVRQWNHVLSFIHLTLQSLVLAINKENKFSRICPQFEVQLQPISVF